MTTPKHEPVLEWVEVEESNHASSAQTSPGDSLEINFSEIKPAKRKSPKSGSQDSLSKKDLRYKLFESLKGSDIENSLKSQLRSFMIGELRKQTDSRIFASPPVDPTRPVRPIIQRVVDSLIVDYLRHRGNEFTLSVFLPECGLNQPGQVLSEDDIYRILRLDHTTTLIRLLRKAMTTSQSGAIIIKVLESLARVVDVPALDKEMQTDADADDLVEHQIRRIDKDLKPNSNRQQLASVLEDRLYRYQHNLQIRMKNEMDEQLTKFKELEIAAMRVEERQRYNAEIANVQSDCQKRILELRQKQSEEVENSRKRIETRERELEQSNIDLRQRLIESSNKTVLMEAQLRAEAELQAKALAFEKEGLQRRLEEMQSQMNDMQDFKERYATRMQEAIAQYKIDLNREHANVLSQAEIEKAKLQAEKAILEERKVAVERLADQVKESQTELELLHTTVKSLKAQLHEAERERDDYAHLIKDLRLQVSSQSTSTALEFELHSLKMQLVEAEKTAEKRQEEYQNLLKDIMNPKNDVQKELSKAKKSEAKWQRECQDLVAKLDIEISRNEQLQRMYEDEVLKTKELKREVADLRLALHRAQLVGSIPNFSDIKPHSKTDLLPDPHDIFTPQPSKWPIPDPMQLSSFSPYQRTQQGAQQRPHSRIDAGEFSESHHQSNRGSPQRAPPPSRFKMATVPISEAWEAGIADLDTEAYYAHQSSLGDLSAEEILDLRQHQLHTPEWAKRGARMVAAGGATTATAATARAPGGPAVAGKSRLPVASPRASEKVIDSQKSSGIKPTASQEALPPVEVGGEFVDDVIKSFTVSSPSFDASRKAISRSQSRLSDHGAEEVNRTSTQKPFSLKDDPTVDEIMQRYPTSGNEKPEKPSVASNVKQAVSASKSPNIPALFRSSQNQQTPKIIKPSASVESTHVTIELDDDEKDLISMSSTQRKEKEELEKEEVRERERLAKLEQERELERQQVEEQQRKEREAYEQRRRDRERRDRELAELDLQHQREKEEERVRMQERRAREAEEVRQVELERKRAADEMRKAQEEERRKAEEAKRKEAEQMRQLEELENDPMMQKYLAIVKEKNKTETAKPKSDSNSSRSKSSQYSFNMGEGETLDEVSGPSTSSNIQDDPW